MALQEKDLRSLALGGDVADLQELHYTHKGLEDVSALASAPNLLNINISYNNLAALAGLESLQQLQLLDISHNRIKSLKPLASLTGLQVFKASHNKVAQLAPLATCTNLRELWLHHNQVASHSQLSAVSTLPSLAVLFLSPNPLCDSLKAEHRAATVHALPSLQVLDGQNVSDADRSAAAEFAAQQVQLQTSASANTPDAEASPPSGLSSSFSRVSKAAGLPNKAGLPSSPGRGRGMQAVKSKSDGIRHQISKGAAGGGVVATAAPSDAATATGFGDAIGQLPKFDIDKHGNRLDKPFDPYVLTGTAALKGTGKPKQPESIETGYQTFYGHTSQHQAVIVRSDGSATAQYPTEGVAVSVDPDQTGGTRGGMRLLATYRSTGLAAVMFEADGTGSVQYPNGNLWMSFTAETDRGALYSHSGEVTCAWTSADEQPIEILLDQHLGFCYSGRQPVVYFACEGQTHRFVQGQNPPRHEWDNISDVPDPSFLQELANRNKLVSYASATPAASTKADPTAAKAISGPSGEQLSAISAALQAVQASMSGTLSQLGNVIGEAAIAGSNEA